MTARTARLEWIDTVRGFAVLVVAILHTGPIYGLFTGDLPPIMRQLGLAAPWRMPILMFLSGYLLPRAFAKDTRSFVTGKLRNLAWPFLIWSVLFCLAAGKPEMLLTRTPWVGGTYLWYFLFLMSYFVVAFFGRRLGWPVLAIYALALSYLMPDGSKYGERLFLHMALFFSGGIAGHYSDRFAELVSSRTALLLLPVGALLSGLSIAYWPDSPVNSTPTYFSLYVAAIIGLCAFAQRIEASPLISPIRYVGRQSVVFYVVHVPVYYALMNLGLHHLVSGKFLTMAAMFAIAMLIATLLARLRTRSALVELLFVGPTPPWDRKVATATRASAPAGHG